MSEKLSERAEELDKMASTDISERMTLEEAEKIVSVWGVFLEHTGFLLGLFGTDIPESVLPYPKHILVGAINKMARFYHQNGQHQQVEALEMTLMELVSYANDQDAIEEAVKTFSNQNWRDAMLPALKKSQENQMEAGFVIDKQLWSFSRSRRDSIEDSLESLGG